MKPVGTKREAHSLSLASVPVYWRVTYGDGSRLEKGVLASSCLTLLPQEWCFSRLVKNVPRKTS
jgi:hypothetical protein